MHLVGSKGYIGVIRYLRPLVVSTVSTFLSSFIFQIRVEISHVGMIQPCQSFSTTKNEIRTSSLNIYAAFLV